MRLEFFHRYCQRYSNDDHHRRYSKFAKKYKGYRSVCLIDNEEKRRKALTLFELADVWGIGRQTLKKLNDCGVFTTIDFTDKTEEWVKRRFNLPVVQT